MLVKELAADMVLLGVEESKYDTMLQMLSPGTLEWQNVRTVKHGCEVPLMVRGVQYMFRLADETGQTAFSNTLVKVLTPPAAPALLGIGRNVCVFWDNSVPRGMPTEVAASVVEQSGLQYIVSWHREYGRASGFRSHPPSDLDDTTKTEPEPAGSLALERRDLALTGGGTELVLLAAFPQFQADTDYRITLRTISSGENSDENGEDIIQSAASPAVHWFTGLSSPSPLSRIAASNEMTLKLPLELDACGVLETVGLKAQRVVEGQDEGSDAFQRLQTQSGNSTLPNCDTVSLIGIPADARCGIRIRCAIDIRVLGADHFFWDTTAVLEVETVPNPPVFCGTAFHEKTLRPSLLVSWPPRTISTLFREPEAATYQVQIYSRPVSTFITVASTSSSNIDLFDLSSHSEGRSMVEISDLEPGVCACVRLLRAPANPASLSLPAHQAAAVVLLAPLPPAVTLLPSNRAGKDTVARVSWDGALDITRLPENMVPLPFEIALEVASTSMLPGSRSHGEGAKFQTHSLKIRPINPIANGRPPWIFQRPCSFQTIATSDGAAVLTALLAPGLNYYFRLRMRTSNGIATSSSVEICTKPTAPSAPPGVFGMTSYFISAAGHRAPFLRLSWRTPLSHGVPVDRYLVQVRRPAGKAGSWGSWRPIYAGPQVSCGDEATLHQGKILAQYRVKAGSSLGWSSYSCILTVNAPVGLETWRDDGVRDCAVFPNLEKKSNNVTGLTITEIATSPNNGTAAASTGPVCSSLNVPGSFGGTQDDKSPELIWPSENRELAESLSVNHPVKSKIAEIEVIYQVEDLLGYPVSTKVLRTALSQLRGIFH